MTEQTRRGYASESLSFNRRAVRASASVSRSKNTIHSITEVDISVPRMMMKKHYEERGKKISLTAYIVTCLAKTLKDYPEFNSFIKGRRIITLHDITVSVLVEKETGGEKVPEPVGIKALQDKSLKQVHDEIRNAQSQKNQKLGKMTGLAFFNLIPGFLLKTFIRIADKNIKLAKTYGKVAVTSVGMFSKEALWFVPHGSATVLLTVGSISNKAVNIEGVFESREHLCLTVSYDHDIIDGAPAARFMNQLTAEIKSGKLIYL